MAKHDELSMRTFLLTAETADGFDPIAAIGEHFDDVTDVEDASTPRIFANMILAAHGRKELPAPNVVEQHMPGVNRPLGFGDPHELFALITRSLHDETLTDEESDDLNYHLSEMGLDWKADGLNMGTVLRAFVNWMSRRVEDSGPAVRKECAANRN